MKMKKCTVLLLSGALCAVTLLGGCGSVIDELPIGKTSQLEAEIDPADDIPSSTENTTIKLTSRWYDKDGNALTDGTVTITMNDSTVSTGEIGKTGYMQPCDIPTGQKLLFTVKDASGSTIGNSKVIYVVSEEYSVIAIAARGTGSDTQKVELPVGKDDIVAAMYIDSGSLIGNANVTTNRGELEKAEKALKKAEEKAAKAEKKKSSKSKDSKKSEKKSDSEENNADQENTD